MFPSIRRKDRKFFPRSIATDYSREWTYVSGGEGFGGAFKQAFKQFFSLDHLFRHFNWAWKGGSSGYGASRMGAWVIFFVCSVVGKNYEIF